MMIILFGLAQIEYRMTFLRFEIKSEAHDMMSDMKEGDVVVNT